MQLSKWKMIAVFKSVYSNGFKSLMSEKHIYKIVFVNREQVYEVYAKKVYQGDMYGFIIIEDFIFGEKSTIVLDPSEEKLRIEFEGVTRSFIPMHEIVRIDQVERQGAAKIISEDQSSAQSSKVSSLYFPEKK